MNVNSHLLGYRAAWAAPPVGSGARQPAVTALQAPRVEPTGSSASAMSTQGSLSEAFGVVFRDASNWFNSHNVTPGAHGNLSPWMQSLASALSGVYAVAREGVMKLLEAFGRQGPIAAPLPTPAPAPSPSPGPVPAPTPDSAVTPPTGRYQVKGLDIFDPQGQRFVVKGVVTQYNAFLSQWNPGYMKDEQLAAAEKDFRMLKDHGANLVRVFLEPKMVATEADREKLKKLVAQAEAQGLVAQLSVTFTESHEALPFLGYLAETFRDSPHVWIQPMNEPTPEEGWEVWHKDHQAYVKAIRDKGFTGPLVINTPGWSWDHTQIDRYPLNDDNLLYGAHRYANNNGTFNEAERAAVEQSWAHLASKRAFIVDEVGNFNGPQFRNSLAWTEGFTDYLANWVNHQGGDGAVAFTWRWSDGNRMINHDDTLTDWGRVYTDGFLDKVPGTR